MTEFFTEVECRHADANREQIVRFGNHAWKRPLDEQRYLLGFAANNVLAYYRRGLAGNPRLQSLVVLHTKDPGSIVSTLVGIRPGGELLLHVTDRIQIERALVQIRAIEALSIDPAAAAPTYWRHLHNFLVTGQTPTPYTLERHRAWLLRKGVQR